jgi:hypothetical protein
VRVGETEVEVELEVEVEVEPEAEVEVVPKWVPCLLENVVGIQLNFLLRFHYNSSSILYRLNGHKLAKYD